MESASLRVLLVDETGSDVSHLVNYLGRLGCLPVLSRSCEGACAVLLREQCDLLLFMCLLPGGDCHELSALLVGRQVSLFYFLAVEGGCWWIPRIYDGQECQGETALRPGEFALVLKELIGGATSSRKWAHVPRQRAEGQHPRASEDLSADEH